MSRSDRVALPLISRTDVILGLGWASVAVIAVWIGTGLLDARYLSRGTMDVWFEADVSRVFENMTNRWSNHSRASVHPLFGLLALPPVLALTKILGLSQWTAVRALLAAVAGLWGVGVFAVLRMTGCRRVESSAFTWVGMTSAGAVFWSCIPEIHTMASLTIVVALLLVALATHRKVPELLEVFVSAGTLGLTVTNWMAGISASFSHRSWRRTLQVSINAFFVVVILWVLRRSLTPSATFFLGNPSETEHIRPAEALGSIRIAIAFLMHSMVMPAIALVERQGAAEWPIMIVQPSAIGSAGHGA